MYHIGTGKTIMCRACAYETGATFYYVSPSSILSKYHGESEHVLRKLFEKAREYKEVEEHGGDQIEGCITGTNQARKHAILFFDEIDALGTSRSLQNDRTYFFVSIYFRYIFFYDSRGF